MEKKARKLTLALGNSNHTHMLISREEFTFTEGADNSIQFLLSTTGIIQHEEHDRIVLPVGFRHFKVNQVEFNPFDRTSSPVWD